MGTILPAGSQQGFVSFLTPRLHGQAIHVVP